MISGINNMAVYYYNGDKYFFFGDLHKQNNHPCRGYCDHFNYQFTDIETYHNDCTAIGPLLYYWLNYNELNHIETHLYIEESWTTKPITYYDPIYKEINKREPYHNFDTVFPFQDMSWLELTSALLNRDQFHVNHVDIRAVDGHHVDPFHLVPDVSYVTFLIEHYQAIFKELLLNQSSVTHPIYEEKLQLMRPILPLNVNDDIYNFIINLCNEYMAPVVDNYYTKLNWYFEYDDEYSMPAFMAYYQNHFTVLSAYLMDAYVLSTIFKSTGEKIIYTGAYHIEIYQLYFKHLGIKPLFIAPTQEMKCIKTDIIPIQKYRNAWK